MMMTRRGNPKPITGRKVDLTHLFGVIEPATRERYRSKRRRVLSESEGPTQPIQIENNGQTSTVGKTVLPIGLGSHQSTLPGPSQHDVDSQSPARSDPVGSESYTYHGRLRHRRKAAKAERRHPSTKQSNHGFGLFNPR